MFRHETCTGNDVSAVLLNATENNSKLSEFKKQQSFTGDETPADLGRVTSKDQNYLGDERSQDILSLRKYEKKNRAKSRGASER